MERKYKPEDCPHADDWSNEVIFGQKTGDIICFGCGEVFMPSEPEYARMKAGKPGRVPKEGDE